MVDEFPSDMATLGGLTAGSVGLCVEAVSSGWSSWLYCPSYYDYGLFGVVGSLSGSANERPGTWHPRWSATNKLALY